MAPAIRYVPQKQDDNPSENKWLDPALHQHLLPNHYGLHFPSGTLPRYVCTTKLCSVENRLPCVDSNRGQTESKVVSNMSVDWVGYGYAALIASGGVIGYVKAGSVPSLAAGVLFGGLAGFGAYQISNDPKQVWVSLATSGALTGVMGKRFYGSRKFMPAGLMAAASLVMVGKLGLSLLQKPQESCIPESIKQEKLYDLSDLPSSTIFGCPVHPAVDRLHGGGSAEEIPRSLPQGRVAAPLHLSPVCPPLQALVIWRNMQSSPALALVTDNPPPIGASGLFTVFEEFSHKSRSVKPLNSLSPEEV
ncbi:hypothetical protein F7725_028611 [Dissostichus mawsoni]|uniref:Transmembrane protein 14C n=4 Tax=Notothenioidei TaxID=8205 RepID=A0A7J5XGT9_DISMA|nr:hypothetical protein F7725_028611 [Dissostichus mawsoni]